MLATRITMVLSGFQLVETLQIFIIYKSVHHQLNEIITFGACLPSALLDDLSGQVNEKVHHFGISSSFVVNPLVELFGQQKQKHESEKVKIKNFNAVLQKRILLGSIIVGVCFGTCYKMSLFTKCFKMLGRHNNSTERCAGYHVNREPHSHFLNVHFSTISVDCFGEIITQFID